VFALDKRFRETDVYSKIWWSKISSGVKQHFQKDQWSG